MRKYENYKSNLNDLFPLIQNYFSSTQDEETYKNLLYALIYSSKESLSSEALKTYYSVNLDKVYNLITPEKELILLSSGIQTIGNMLRYEIDIKVIYEHNFCQKLLNILSNVNDDNTCIEASWALSKLVSVNQEFIDQFIQN